jgi:cytochrome c-type biogenesis protein CcmH/NrfG
LDPSQVTARVGLGAIRFERGDYADAIRCWQDALSRNSGLVLTASNLAMAQWRTGDRAGAEATLRRVLDLSPGFQSAADLLVRLMRSSQ